MATVTLSPSMVRQPFALVNDARLKKLSNVKNVQNTLTSFKPPTSLKRPFEASCSFEDNNLENVDPKLFSSKKTKIDIQLDFKPSSGTSPPSKATFDFKMPPMKVLKSTKSAQMSVNAGAASLKRKLVEDTPREGSTPGAPRSPKARRLDSAPPTAAGRSPNGKRFGVLSRRRLTSTVTRINPPSFGGADQHKSLPFSIDAALSGTLSPPAKPTIPKYVPTLREMTPQRWKFNIHQESPEDERGNLMLHSANSLYISKEKYPCDKDEEKENIPPADAISVVVVSANASVSTSRKDMMTDEPRTPLADLDARDFYPEGLDASSYITIPEDQSSNQPSGVVPEPKTGWEDLLAQVEASKKHAATIGMSEVDSGAEIAIWESESAKGEDEAAAQA